MMDTDIRDAVEAGFVEAYLKREEAKAHMKVYRYTQEARVRLVEAERVLNLSREQVKVLWS